jgi:hypothetical protein
MMFGEYQYNVKQDSNFNAFCRSEGLDSLYILSIVKEEKRRQKQERIRKAIGRLFGKFAERIKSYWLPGIDTGHTADMELNADIDR